MNKYSGALLLLAALGRAPSATAQTPARDPNAPRESATKEGQPRRLVLVLDAVSYEPVDGAVVRDSVWGAYTSTMKEGLARVDFVKPIADTGRLAHSGLVVIQKVGYEPASLLVTLDDTSSFMVALQRVQTLEPVVSTARYRMATDPGARSGFAKRCTVPHAACVGPAELEAHPASRLFDFLAKADGIFPDCRNTNSRPTNRRAFDGGRPQRAEGGRLCVARMHKSASPGLCIPTYFVDGYRWAPLDGSAQDQISGAFDPSVLEGIEVYASYKERPLRFTTESECGAVVIWTKASSEKKSPDARE